MATTLQVTMTPMIVDTINALQAACNTIQATDGNLSFVQVGTVITVTGTGDPVTPDRTIIAFKDSVLLEDPAAFNFLMSTVATQGQVVGQQFPFNPEGAEDGGYSLFVLQPKPAFGAGFNLLVPPPGGAQLIFGLGPIAGGTLALPLTGIISVLPSFSYLMLDLRLDIEGTGASPEESGQYTIYLEPTFTDVWVTFPSNIIYTGAINLINHHPGSQMSLNFPATFGDTLYFGWNTSNVSAAHLWVVLTGYIP